MTTPFHHTTKLASLLALLLLPLIAGAQTLNIANDSQTHATLTNTVVTMTGRSELRVTGTGDPIAGCTIHLNSPDAWFYLPNILPSAVNSTFLSRVRVNGVNAALGTNARIVQHGQGAVVIPHGDNFSPLEVFDGRHFAGRSKRLFSYVKYDDTRLGTMRDAIRSFKLKHGYMATLSESEDGTNFSRCYIAQDGDLEVGRLPDDLDRDVHFVRVLPWRWVSKKGSCDVFPTDLKANWHYNWSISLNSALDWEYAAIKQQPYWPSTDQDWKTRGVNHLLGFNEPDNSVEDAYQNLTPQGSVSDAVARYDELAGTGLRVGAPAVTDGGTSWITDFINQANAAGVRVDYVPVHYYRSTSGNNPTTAANNLYNFLKSIHDVAQRPIWVTEFNNGANWTDNAHDPTAAQNRDVIEAMIEMMDSTPWIERYAIYSDVEWFRDTHYAEGGLTPMGQMYRDHVAPIGYLQEMADAGTGNSARYDFDGDAHDSWGNGQDGMLVGAPTFVAGKYGQALQLDGTDYVQLSPRIGDTTSFTFAAWVFWNGGGNWQRIFDFGAGTSNYLALTPKAGTSGGLRFLMRDGGGEQQLNTTTLAQGVWTHVAVTITGDTGKLFVNGALVNTNAAMTINPADVGTQFNYLGKSQTAADPLFNGRLDDVRIVSSAMTDEEIATLASTAPPQFTSTTLAKPAATKLQPYTSSLAANATGGAGTRTFSKMSGPAWLAVAQDGGLTGVPTFVDGGTNNFLVRVTDANDATHTATLTIPVTEAAGIVARYAFDANTSASVGAAHGTATGAPIYGTGRNGQAIDLDATDDFVTLPAGVASTDEITIAAWVNWDGGGNWQRIFDFGNGNGEYFFLTPKSSANTLRFGIVTEAVAEQQLNAAVLPIGAWTHVAVTLGAGTGRLYVNGAFANTAAITLKPSDIAAAVNFIGKSQWSADPLFNGRVDDFMIFNRALNGIEISALVNARAPSFTADPLAKPAATAGTAYNHSLATNASDPDDGALTFSKVSGPAWLTVAADGRISGLPGADDAGVNRFIVRVTDSTGLADDAVMNITVSAPGAGLVAHYQFDGTTLNTSGDGAGTTTGSPAYEDAIFDKALGFDGSNDLVTMPANIVGALTDATFAMRVRWDGGAAWQRVFDFGGGTAQYMIFTPSSGSGTAQFAILNSGGTTQRLAGPDPLPVGEWAHVAVTLIGSTGTLYVNGVAVAATSITIDPANVSQTANYLGDSQFTADPLFNGALDDFRIYNRGLTAAEVLALAAPPTATSVPLDYAGWTTAYNFPGGQSGALANAADDALLNIWEFFHGTNPLTHTAAPIVAQALGSRLAITFPRNSLANDVTVTIQGADSPAGPWTDLARSINGAAFTILAAGAVVNETGAGTTRTVEFRDAYEITVQPRRCLRLRLQQP